MPRPALAAAALAVLLTVARGSGADGRASINMLAAAPGGAPPPPAELMLSPEALDDVFGAVDVHAVERGCVDMPWSVCAGGQPLLPPAKLKSLVGRWSFDDLLGLDGSGHGNHMSPPPPAGPARGGVGASAFFNGTLYSEVPHAPAFESPELTVSFWIYLMQDSTGAWRTLLSKGDGEQELTPTVQLWPHTRQLHVRVTTVGRQVVAFDSAAMVPLQRWTHVALVVQGKLVQIYVNGIADTQHVLTSAAHFNRGPLYVGRDPWQPGAQAFLDDLTVHAAALSDGRLAAEAEGALGPVSPSFVRLGCSNCSLEAARNACADFWAGYHLCFEDEAMGGAYMASRAMGWSHGKNGSLMWYGDLEPREAEEGERRLAVCCKDNL
jgi:hypothetical protein